MVSSIGTALLAHSPHTPSATSSFAFGCSFYRLALCKGRAASARSAGAAAPTYPGDGNGILTNRQPFPIAVLRRAS
jgi:hypothetical protein